MTDIVIVTGTSWTTPSDWDNAANSIHCIGGGGGGGGGRNQTGGEDAGGGGGSGGGGEYRSSANQTATGAISIQIGAAGTAGAANGGNGGAGTATWWKTSGTINADFGAAGQGAVTTTGGTAGVGGSAGTGTTGWNGGAGGAGGNGGGNRNGGGGGAGGGGAGGTTAAGSAGTAGVNGSGKNGGNGGAGGAGGTTSGGTAGTAGSGGGDKSNGTAGGAGGNSTRWTDTSSSDTAGSGAGGGGGGAGGAEANGAAGGAGGEHGGGGAGGGGGGGKGGSGAIAGVAIAGVIFITYVPSADPTVVSVDADNDTVDTRLSVVIVGTLFEATQGTGKVEIGSSSNHATATLVELEVNTWAATSINVDLHEITTINSLDTTLVVPGTLYCFVTNGTGDLSTGLAITVNKPGATWLELINTNTTIDVDGGNVSKRLRILVKNTGGASTAQAFKYRFSKNSGAYGDMTAVSSSIRTVGTANFADGDDLVDSLLGSGTLVTNNNAAEETSGTFTLGTQFVGVDEIETELSFQVVAADLANTDTIDIRVYESDATAFTTYTQTPRITITKTGGGGGSIPLFYKHYRDMWNN